MQRKRPHKIELGLPPSLRRERARNLPPSLRKSNLTTNQGGGPPPGYGVDETESHLWQEPVYRKHPTTSRLEAVNEGLFFRMWPEHVKKIREMKVQGWAHVEIVRTSKELWQKQQETYEEDQKLVDEHKNARAEERTQQVQDMRSGSLGQNEYGDENDEYDEFERGFSSYTDEDYADRLEQFRGRFYSRDPSGPGLARQGNLMRGTGAQREKPLSRKQIDRVQSVLEHPSFNKGAKGKKGTPHDLPALPYAYNALKPYVSEETMRFHHKVHHAKYVEELNKLTVNTRYEPDSPEELLFRINERLGDQAIAQKIRDYGGGHLNHSLFWASLIPNGRDVEKNSTLVKDVKKQFGSWGKMITELKDAALSRFGAGWAWLAYSETEKLVVYSTLNQDNPILWGDIPLLGLDVWEHAYYLDFGPDRKSYVRDILSVVDWRAISRRYEAAMSPERLGFEKKSNGGGFQVYMHKGDTTGGERALTPEQRRKQREMSFTRKETGVANASFTPAPEENPNALAIPKGP